MIHTQVLIIIFLQRSNCLSDRVVCSSSGWSANPRGMYVCEKRGYIMSIYMYGPSVSICFDRIGNIISTADKNTFKHALILY